MLTEAQRLKQFGIRNCEVCTKKYLPHRDVQKTCCNKCGVISGARNRTAQKSRHQSTCGTRRQVKQFKYTLLRAALKFWELEHPDCVPTFK